MSKNYFSNFDINKGSFGFSLFNTSFVNNVPTTITSGAGGLTLSVVGGGLRNKVSLELNKPSAINTQGQGLISDVLTLDRTDLARVLRFAFEFERTAGTIDASGTSTSSFEVWIYDVTNAQWIQPSGFRGITQITLPGTCSGEFQPPSTALALRLAIIYRQTDTNTWTMRFDEFELLQQSRSRGAIVTDWREYTPTGNLTNNVQYFGQWRRVGSDIECRIRVNFSGANTQGSLNFSDAQIFNGLGVTTDTSRLINTGGDPRFSMGTWNAVDSVVNGAWSGTVTRAGSGFYALQYQDEPVPNEVNTATNSPFTISSGDNFNLFFRAPIAGWSSGQVVSSDAETRVVSGYISRAISANVFPAGGATFRYYTPSFNQIEEDTHSSFITSAGDTAYRIPVSGSYTVEFGARFGAPVATVVQMLIELNGSQVTNAATLTGTVLQGAAIMSTTDSDGRSAVAKVTRQFRAGDVLRPQVFRYGNNNLELGNGFSWFSVTRNSGPSQIAASDQVNARYINTAATAFTAGVEANLPFATRDFDSHLLYDGTTATIPAPGKYRISVFVRTQGVVYNPAGAAIFVRRNGTNVARIAAVNGTSPASLAYPVGGSTTLNFNAGDLVVMRFISDANVSLNTANTDCHFSIERVGN